MTCYFSLLKALAEPLFRPFRPLCGRNQHKLALIRPLGPPRALETGSQGKGLGHKAAKERKRAKGGLKRPLGLPRPVPLAYRPVLARLAASWPP